MPKNQLNFEVGVMKKNLEMKQLKTLLIIAVASLFLTSCAMVSSPVTAFVYTDVKAPVAVTSNSISSKVGSAEAVSYLGIVAIGDASVETAAKAAGITKIHHVDAHATNILGFFAKYKIYVYGE